MSQDDAGRPPPDYTDPRVAGAAGDEERRRATRRPPVPEPDDPPAAPPDDAPWDDGLLREPGPGD